MQTKNFFLSCDWGSSSFRLRIIEAPMLKLIEEETSNEGIKDTFQLWKETANPNDDDRYPFYLEIIDFHIKNLEKWLNVSLDRVPLIVSGMASSSIGMKEVSYSDIPIRIDGSDINKKFIPATAQFNHDIVIISGAKTPDDVMRGEETQLVGAIDKDDGEEKIYVFTGTHSKHILVKDGMAIGFRTYMTGEFFDLLYKHSLLTTGLEKGQGFLYPENQASFESGVKDSLAYSLLHSAFLTRVNYLLKKRSKQENYYYLSGLLIGYELGDLLKYYNKKVYLVSNEALTVYYETAFRVLSKDSGASLIVQSADEALIRGQWKMLSDAKYIS